MLRRFDVSNIIFKERVKTESLNMSYGRIAGSGQPRFKGKSPGTRLRAEPVENKLFGFYDYVRSKTKIKLWIQCNELNISKHFEL